MLSNKKPNFSGDGGEAGETSEGGGGVEEVDSGGMGDDDDDRQGRYIHDNIATYCS